MPLPSSSPQACCSSPPPLCVPLPLPLRPAWPCCSRSPPQQGLFCQYLVSIFAGDVASAQGFRWGAVKCTLVWGLIWLPGIFRPRTGLAYVYSANEPASSPLQPASQTCGLPAWLQVGTPEQLLSDLGRVSYHGYWTRILLTIIKDHVVSPMAASPGYHNAASNLWHRAAVRQASPWRISRRVWDVSLHSLGFASVFLSFPVILGRCMRDCVYGSLVLFTVF